MVGAVQALPSLTVTLLNPSGSSSEGSTSVKASAVAVAWPLFLIW